MTSAQHRRRQRIHTVSAVTGFLFLTITLIGPALGGLFTQ